MALTLTAENEPATYDYSQKRQILQGTATVTGSYTAGGEAINWTTIKDASGAAVMLNSLATTPKWVEFHTSVPGSTPLWYLAQYNYSTNKLQFAVTGAAAGDGFEELAASAYPADLTGATLVWKAEFIAE